LIRLGSDPRRAAISHALFSALTAPGMWNHGVNGFLSRNIDIRQIVFAKAP
jgi:hypothetical protein